MSDMSKSVRASAAIKSPELRKRNQISAGLTPLPRKHYLTGGPEEEKKKKDN